MKKRAILLCFVILASLLTACAGNGHSQDYEVGYEDGFSGGYTAGKIDFYDEYFEDGYDVGFDDGYDKGYDHGCSDARLQEKENPQTFAWVFTENAIDYVTDSGKMHPEEAQLLIAAYLDREPYHPDGSPPSHQEFLGAVDSLNEFFDYFYCKRYKE